MNNNIANQLGPKLDELTRHLANERFTPGTFHGVPVGDSVVTFRPAGEPSEQMLLVQCKGLPTERLAGCRVSLTADGHDGPNYRGWLNRRGCTFVGGLTPGAYRLELAPRPQEQRLPEPCGEPAEIPFDAASEVLLVQPIELTHGRLYWVARPECLVLLWQSTRPGAAGSARVLSAGAATSGESPLLIPVAVGYQVVPWPGEPGEDIRLQFEGTEETVVVPAAWFKAGTRYLAAGLYAMHVPTLAQMIEHLETEVQRQRQDAADVYRDSASPGSVAPVAVSPAQRGIWVAEYEADYVLWGSSTDHCPPPPIQEMNSTKWDAREIQLLYRAEEIPYGVVLIEIIERSGSNRTLGHKIVALPKFEDVVENAEQESRGPYRTGAISFGAVAGEADPKEVCPRLTPATKEHLTLFRPHLDEIRQLLSDPSVAFDDELSRGVRNLCHDLEGLETSEERLS